LNRACCITEKWADTSAAFYERKARTLMRAMAIVDIFRPENRKIVEHRDVIQPVPETSANRNTMF
jgi:predicted SnoaL-like aldol condensation-catalyzing enzyme